VEQVEFPRKDEPHGEHHKKREDEGYGFQAIFGYGPFIPGRAVGGVGKVVLRVTVQFIFPYSDEYGMASRHHTPQYAGNNNQKTTAKKTNNFK
jgi:hypothetical protein